MSGNSEQERGTERAISVHPELTQKRLGEAAWCSRAEEFDRLVEASGCEIAASIRLPVRRPVPGTLFGSGQTEHVRQMVQEHEATVVFVDHPLSPVQQRNLEKAWKAKVVDRTGLILEIFASRARTREGVLQVELASLNYQLGRLVRSWTHLERQRGGFGFLGGPGERQIELDRRLIRGRIRQLEKELEKVRRMRATQRAGRRRRSLPTVALVGYTNAGKSTLFNRLSQARVYVADQLFATLDPTLRLVELSSGQRLMISDTVGFVQELPHELVDAFRATLEEVVEADLILHVRDAADPLFAEHAEVVRHTLERLGLAGDASPPIVEVWNKKDLIPGIRSRIREGINGSRVAVSAVTGEGVEDLLALLARWAAQGRVEMDLDLSLSDGKSLAFCHEHGEVLHKHIDDKGMHLKVRLSPADAARFACEAGVYHLKEG